MIVCHLRRGASGSRTMMSAHSIPQGEGGYARTGHGAGIWRDLSTRLHRPGCKESTTKPSFLSSLPTGTGCMTGLSTEALDAFRGRHALRSPQRPSDFDHETIQIEAEQGFRLLGLAPARSVSFGCPPASRTEPGANRYLWVIDERGIPYILEEPLAAICSNLPKHTNLTGGGRAYLGGEMWFSSPMEMYVSGGSGRYPPVDRRQLEDAVQVLRSFGYEVDSLGWDDGTGMARRRLESSS